MDLNGQLFTVTSVSSDRFLSLNFSNSPTPPYRHCTGYNFSIAANRAPVDLVVRRGHSSNQAKVKDFVFGIPNPFLGFLRVSPFTGLITLNCNPSSLSASSRWPNHIEKSRKVKSSNSYFSLTMYIPAVQSPVSGDALFLALFYRLFKLGYFLLKSI